MTKDHSHVTRNRVSSVLPCCMQHVSFTEASERSDFNQIAVGCISLKLKKLFFLISLFPNKIQRGEGPFLKCLYILFLYDDF